MSTPTSTRIGHGLAKVLGIKLATEGPDAYAHTSDPVTRGESVFSIGTSDSYFEDEPSVPVWLRQQVPDGHQIARYLSSLFPFTHWILRYNVQWLIGDLIAGITIGAIVVPQGMGYAKLAELDVQYGLYSAFMGVLIYWFFATSKDITIGPVAVLSLVTGDVVNKVHATRPDIAAQDIVATVAILAGSIVFLIGLIRLGWLVDFISLTSVSAFITGSAITIAVGQVPNMFGIEDYFNTRASAYLVFINTLKNLHHAKIDAAMGLTALFMLYALRATFNYLARRQPNHRRIWFFCNTLRTAFVILLYTFISFLTNRGLHGQNATHSRFFILGTVPRGFTAAGVPNVTKEICSLVAGSLPAVVIVMLVEHISIAKSFGRINGYVINPSQEMLAIGITNMLTPFLGGYPSTGSFSRTAVKSKAGVRTPFAGVYTAIVVLLAVYALPAVFFYIPNASLAAVIIHAVGDLIIPPNTVYQFWRVSPLEVIIFFIGVFVMLFNTIENGVYTVVVVSAALLLWRIFKAQGRFLGKVNVRSVVGGPGSSSPPNGRLSEKNTEDTTVREVFLPINAEDGSNPRVHPEHPYPGIFIYRFNEGFNYPNASNYLEAMTQEIFRQCQRTTANSFARPGDRPWNNPGPRKGEEVNVNDRRPTLKAVILDFSSVNNVDVTSVQVLIDIRNQLDRFAAPDRVQWHFAHVNNRWTRRALAAAGFGYPTTEDGGFQRWKPIFSVADLGGSNSAAAAAAQEDDIEVRQQQNSLAPHKNERGEIEDIEATADSESGRSIEKQLRNSVAYSQSQHNGDQVVVQSLNRPFFHVDLSSAIQSAIHNSSAFTGRQESIEVSPGKSGIEGVHT